MLRTKKSKNESISCQRFVCLIPQNCSESSRVNADHLFLHQSFDVSINIRKVSRDLNSSKAPRVIESSRLRHAAVSKILRNTHDTFLQCNPIHEDANPDPMQPG